MKVTFKLEKRNRDSQGRVPVFLRIRDDNSETSINSGVSVLDKDFKNGVLKTTVDNYISKIKILNSLMETVEVIIGDIKEDGKEPNPHLIKKLLVEKKESRKFDTPKPNKTFWKSFEEWENTKRGKSRGYRKTLTTLKNRLNDYESFKKTPITFDFVVYKTIIFQSEFENFLWDTKKLSNNYINKLYGNLSSFLFHSYQLGYINRKPKIKTLQELDIDEKIYLRTNEVVKLFNSIKWDYKEGKDFSKNVHIYMVEQTLEGTRGEEFGGILKLTNWEVVKDIFLFLNSVGCRYSDIPFFKVNDFNFDRDTQIIEWIQQKTDKVNRVPLNDISGFIFKKYSSGKKLEQHLFPKLSIQKFNKHLKLLLKDLKFNRLVSKPKRVGSYVVNTDEVKLWEVISSHSGRRGFVKNLIDLGTMDYQTIMKLSSHKTFSQFSKYVSVINDDLLKSRELYREIDTTSGESIENNLVKEFKKLSDENKKMILGLTISLNKK